MRVSARITKGTDTRVKLAEEQAAQPSIARTPRRTPVAPRRAPVAPSTPVGNNQIMAAIVRSPLRRALDLDLSDAPPSDDIKFTSTWGDGDNKFWEKFYTPQDEITQKYIEASEKFELIRGEPNSFGVANLELKPEYVKPIKRIPL